MKSFYFEESYKDSVTECIDQRKITNLKLTLRIIDQKMLI